MRPGPTRCDILFEGLVEGVTLATVEGEHTRVLRDAAERLRHHALRDARGDGFAREALHEAVEVAAAARGKSGSARKTSAHQNRQPKLVHGIPHLPDNVPIMP